MRPVGGGAHPSQANLQPAKSQLTKAAEQKQRQRARERAEETRVVGQRQRRPTGSVSGSARKQQGISISAGMLAGAVALLVLGAAAFMLLRDHHDEPPPANTSNLPPTMKFVTIQQTPAGIIARPQAEDREGDRIVYAISWYVNKTLIRDARTARLKPESYRESNTIQVEVVPSDAFGQGKPMRSQPLTVTDTTSKRPAARPAR